MGRLGYYNDDLLVQHEIEAKRRHKLQDEVLEKWKLDIKTIKFENEDMLEKEARRIAVSRIENSARTADEYDKVTILWDCLGRIEGWRLAKAEPLRVELLTEGEFYKSNVIIPSLIKHEWWRQLLGGKFLDVIYDCPHEIHELTSSTPIYDILKPLEEKQKEILYYLAIRLWTPQRLAVMRGQTDRNIRKVYAKMLGDMQDKLFERLYMRYAKYWSLTTSQVTFIEWYIDKNGKGVIRAELPENEKAAQRRTEHE
ncbi:MAG: hypothetical protein FWF81_06985 [Defluviitaleaceae bacterium]|nr:hypothetical protein [Defluviitaleaceae bacterium]